jgi:HEAT repeat protein
MNGIRLAWLFSLALLIAASALLSADESDIKADEKVLQEKNLKTDGPSLLEFFKQRTLNDAELFQVEALIQQLGANSFAKREVATAKLIARGPVIVPILKKYFDDPDLEIAGRAKKCVANIEQKDYGVSVVRAAARLVADRKPAGGAEVMLEYLPFADNEAVAEDVRMTLAALARVGGKADPAIVKALTSKNEVIRSAAGEALALIKDAEHTKQIWKLLDDPKVLVQYRVALGLTLAENPKAVPKLIELVPKLDYGQASQVELMLIQMTGEKKWGADDAPPKEPVGQSKESRQKFSEAWSKWWQTHSAQVNMARLKEGPKLLGYTMVVLLEAGQIRELGPKNEVRWQINNLAFPLDAQFLPNDHVLVAEYHGGRVTERDLQGNIKWQHNFPNPQSAQRLKNGNTFIVSPTQLVEIDQDKAVKFTYSFPNGERIMKATKLDDGRMVCLTDALHVVVLDEKKEVKNKFNVGLGKLLFGGRLYMTPTGRVLIPKNNEDKVVEYDLDGNVVWELEVKQPVSAVRLPNGNTLVTTMELPGKAREFNRNGVEVWSYQVPKEVGVTKLTRALRR